MLSKLPGEPQAFPHPGRWRSGGRNEKYWKEKTVLAFKHRCKEGRLKAPSTASTSNHVENIPQGMTHLTAWCQVPASWLHPRAADRALKGKECVWLSDQPGHSPSQLMSLDWTVSLSAPCSSEMNFLLPHRAVMKSNCGNVKFRAWK